MNLREGAFVMIVVAAIVWFFWITAVFLIRTKKKNKDKKPSQNEEVK